ncbi:MAG: hypothetical protein ACFCVE_13920 [Phycisphaerae bacterium]
MSKPIQTTIWLFNRTLNNVLFGITLMVLTALYIAVGSGFASVREYFEMNELMFFGAWPLITLMLLLVVNLVVVTFNRIPFTPPRYGVWMVHAGIITLIVGLFQYFSGKTEGLAFIAQGQTARHYYDGFHRALHIEHGSQAWPIAGELPLHDLPRFHAYSPENGQADRLDVAGLRGLRPEVRRLDPKTGLIEPVPLDEVLDLPAPVTFDILAFWPYADMDIGYEPAETGPPALQLRVADAPEEAPSSWLVPGDRTAMPFRSGGVEHAAGTEEEVSRLASAAARVHTLRVSVAGNEHVFHVHPGGTYHIEGTPYAFDVEAFDPAFTTTTGESVKSLQLFIHRADEELLGETPDAADHADHPGHSDHENHTHFRRFVIDGRAALTPFELETDFALGVPDAGPMGQRQTALIDDAIRFTYAFEDPERLIPNRTPAWHRFFTLPDGRLAHLITRQQGASGEVTFREPGQQFVVDLRAGTPAATGEQRTLLLLNHLPKARPYETLSVVPPEQRNPDLGQAGAKQVVKVRVSMGDWSQDVLVPYTQWTKEQRNAWRGGLVRLPGVEAPLRLQLGQETLPLPAWVRLEGFDAVFYDGARGDTSVMRDFKSFITLVQPWDNTMHEATVQLNNPVYYTVPSRIPGLSQSWLFFQAQWDPENQSFTVLGVGNRPGIWTMSLGCGLMTVGLLWAFYLKPVLIRRAKERALAAHAAKIKPPRSAVKEPAGVLEGAAS